MTKPESVFDQLSAGKVPPAAPVVAPNAAPATPVNVEAAASLTNSLDNNLLGQLVQLMVLEQQERLKTTADAKASAASRQAQRDRNAKDQDAKLLLKQARCKHLKGGKRGPKTQNKDYAVYQHRFINFIDYIRCRICGMRWYIDDTVEYLVRKGHKISNHTKIGWREAVAMTDSSTDTMSASEAIPSAIGGLAASQAFKDSAGLAVAPRVVDLDGNIVENVEL
jgi:hypothetical protein